MSRKRVTSGMRPTGSLHLGNLLGALNNWVKLQDEYDCFYFIVDWHALTTPGGRGAVGYENVGSLRDRVMELAVDWLAVGLDPNKSTIFIQSQVSEVAELHLLFSMITPLGWLERNPTYKDMVQSYKIEYPSYGLLGYPTLQSADILLYKGDYVPVGKDQEAHVNMTRDLAARFNSLYGRDVFPITEVLLTEVPKVPGIDGVDRKMSKSSGNYIALSFTEEETTEKVKSMFTDPVKIRKNDPGHPDGCVVYTFHGIYNRENQQTIRKECEGGERGCVACKMELAEKMNGALREMRQRRTEIEKNEKMLREVLNDGASRARRVAEATMKDVRDVMNLPPREL
ncbi:MAG: tryptophan--tRNA ligase [Candidatus Latescibacteria bacterium 4484_7]|nr:MAG: tryptophan--tRNA ligase [Candidatus Latescibacteria bacterium 4484_7]RKZ06071.1 MAG: tryptophan--tRNA ligase [bacterium]